jgi:hypothetical protein
MTRKRRLLLGLGCAWPLVYVLVFLVIPTSRRFFFEHGWSIPRHSLTWLGSGAFLLQVVTLILTGVMVVICVTHAQHAKHIDEEHRIPWTLLIVLANIISLPAYWFLYIRTAAEPRNPGDLYPRRH